MRILLLFTYYMITLSRSSDRYALISGEVLPTYLSSLDLHENAGSVYLVHDALTCWVRRTELFLGQEQCFLFNCHHVTSRLYIYKVYEVHLQGVLGENGGH